MLCSNCGKREAEVLVKQTIDNEVRNIWLCRECAKELGLILECSPSFTISFSLADPEHIRERNRRNNARRRREEQENALTCPECGMTFGRFRETGLLGCPHCYEAFRFPLGAYLQEHQGAESHWGGRSAVFSGLGLLELEPSVAGTDESCVATSTRTIDTGELERLRIELKDAVGQEDYERAATIRDLIKNKTSGAETAVHPAILNEELHAGVRVPKEITVRHDDDSCVDGERIVISDNLSIFDEFASTEPAWYEPTSQDEQVDKIAIVTSAKIVRNMDGMPFPNTCTKSQLFDMAAILLSIAGRSDRWTDCDFRMIDSLDEHTRSLLIEDGLVDKKFSEGGPGRFIIKDSNGLASCLINASEHLTFTARRPGLAPVEALASASKFVDDLELDTASDPVLGFLTADPDRVGSGTEISVLLHLPALDSSGDMGRTMSAFERDWKRVILKKIMNEHENAIGSFYQLSNKVSLSVSPEEIADMVSDAAQALIARELFSRHKITHSSSMRQAMLVAQDEGHDERGAQQSSGGPAAHVDMNDRFWRAWGLLRYARKLAFMEAVNRLSFIKLGSDIGMLPKLNEREWRSLITGIQDAHLSVRAGRMLEHGEEPFVRALVIREFIERAACLSSAAE